MLGAWYVVPRKLTRSGGVAKFSRAIASQVFDMAQTRGFLRAMKRVDE